MLAGRCIVYTWVVVQCACAAVVATGDDTSARAHASLETSTGGGKGSLPHRASLEKNGVRLPPDVLDFVFLLDTSYEASDAIFDRVDAESRYRGLTHRFSLLPFDGCVTDADATAEEDAASAAKFPVEASTSLEAVASAWQETESVGARKECGARHPAVALRRFHEAMDFFANDAEGRFTQSHVHFVLSIGGKFDLEAHRRAALSARAKIEAVLRRHPSFRCSVSVVLDGEDPSSVAVYGSPVFTDAFGDGSHFSPGVTFQRMKLYKSKNSAVDVPGKLNEYLQTAFVFRGLQFRVYDASTVSSKLRLPFNLQPEVGDVLLQGDKDPLAPHECADDARVCGENQFCSEILGCLPDSRSAEQKGTAAAAAAGAASLDSQYMWHAGNQWVHMDVGVSGGVDKALLSDLGKSLGELEVDALLDDSTNVFSLFESKALLSDGGHYPPTAEPMSIKPEVSPSPNPHKATHVKILRAVDDPDDFVSTIIDGGEPVVIRAGLVSEWDAFPQSEVANGGWSFASLKEKLGGDYLMEDVYRTDTDDNLFFSPDLSQPMANLTETVDISRPYEALNMTAGDFFNSIADEHDSRRYYWFGKVPEQLELDLQPSFMLYLTEKDEVRSMQYVWVGEKGVRTHTHFDQDWNFYVQVVGRKRFSLVPNHNADYMYPHPRVHPNWHKSQVDFLHPNLEKFPAFAHIPHVLEAELEPGDILFVPPNYWHHVETLENSVSVTTWSRQEFIYEKMEAIYGYRQKFDRFYNRKGRICGLRLFIDMLVSQLFGVGKVSWYMDRLLRSRYSNMAHLFPARPSDPHMCLSSVSPSKVPTAQFLFSATQFDVQILVEHFVMLPPVHRDFLLADYVEQMVADNVGIESAYAFMRYCFRGQEYHLTTQGEDEHMIWT